MTFNKKHLLPIVAALALLFAIASPVAEYWVSTKTGAHPHNSLSRLFHLGNLLSTGFVFTLITYWWVKKRKDNHLKSAELQRENLRITLNSIGDAIISTDANGYVTRMNPVAEQMTGWTHQTAKGRPLSDVFHIIKAGTGEHVENPVEKVIESGHTVELTNHTSLISKDGSIRQIADSAAPILDTEQRIHGVVLVFRDVSDEYALRAAMEAEQTRNRNILKGTNAGTWDWDLQSNQLTVNTRWAEIIGYSLEELKPTHEMWTRTLHPEDLLACEKILKEHFEGRLDYYDAEFRQRHRDGTWRWVHTRGCVVERATDGTPLHMSGTHLDITERKETAEALRSSKDVLNDVLNNIPMRVYWKDCKSVYQGCNSQFAQDAGLCCPEDVIGKDDFDLNWPTEQAEAYRASDQVMIQQKQSKRQFQESQLLRDKITWIEKSKIPLTNNEGQIVGILGTYEDITQRKATQEALITAKDEAEAANQAKDEFLAVMSHEMRTPLNPIIGFSEILLDSIDTEPERSQLKTILSAGKRQLHLIDDILDYMRISRGTVEVSLENFSLYDLCQAAINDAEFIAHGLELNFEVGSSGLAVEKELLVETDMLIVRRILDNLLNNACKYTRQGSVTLDLSRKAAQTDRFLLKVSDTGIGMSEEVQQSIFKPFSQADSSYTRIHGGIGLGLAICLKLVQQLKGEISVVSKQGQGSCFTVELPLKMIRAHTPVSTHEKNATAPLGSLQEKCHALVVDDQPDNRLIMNALLTRFGATISEAPDGQKAVELCQKESYDLILMDLAMPVLNGFDATRSIRKDSQNRATPIIAITADASPNTQERCKRAGMNTYINKPVHAKQLLQEIERLLT
jgi:PAS domain S-box-containing protein